MDEFRNLMLLLASPAEVQIAAFPSGVCVGDEMVLDLETILPAVEPSLKLEQLEAVKACVDLIDSLSGPDFSDFWCDPNFLRDDERWDAIRKRADHVIQRMGWEYELPQKNGATYVFEDGYEKNI